MRRAEAMATFSLMEKMRYAMRVWAMDTLYMKKLRKNKLRKRVFL